MIDPTTYKLMMSNRIDPSDTTIVSNRLPSDTSVSAYKRKPPKNEKVIVTPIKNYTEKELINQRPIGNLFPSQTQYIGGYKEIKERRAKETKENISKVLKAQSEYLSSPLYLQRASKFYNPAEASLKQTKALQALKEVNILTDAMRTQATPSEKKVELETEVTAPTIAHELGHITGARTKKYGTAIKMSPAERMEIMNRNKTLQSLSKQKNVPASEIQIDEYNEHQISPKENKSDIEALRNILYTEGITKKYGENITPEQFKKALQNKNIKNEKHIKRLQSNFDDKDIIQLNNILAATRTGQQNLA